MSTMRVVNCPKLAQIATSISLGPKTMQNTPDFPPTAKKIFEASISICAER